MGTGGLIPHPPRSSSEIQHRRFANQTGGNRRSFACYEISIMQAWVIAKSGYSLADHCDASEHHVFAVGEKRGTADVNDCGRKRPFRVGDAICEIGVICGFLCCYW